MGLIVVDAGVVIAGLDASDAHHSPAIEALRTATAGGHDLAVPISAYAEVLVHPARRSDAALARAEAAMDALGLSVVPADRAIARSAARLRARHVALRLPDALVIATAVEIQADRLLTTDRRWKSMRGLGLTGRLSVVG